DDACLEGQLVDCTGERLAGERLTDARDLEHDATRLDVGDPPLRRALTATHTGLGGLLRQRSVGVDVDPHLAATLDVTRHRDTRRLDLAVRHIRGRQRLDAVLTERDGGATRRLAAPRGAVLLAVLDLAGNKHG